MLQRGSRACHFEHLEQRSLLAGDLIGHWLADDLRTGVADGETVAAWTDRVGGTTAAAAGAPQLIHEGLDGNATVRFNRADGADNFTVAAADSPLAGADDFTVVVVFATDTVQLNGGTTAWFLNTGLVDATGFFGTTADWGLVLNGSGQLGAGLGGPAKTLYTDKAGLNDGLVHVGIYTRQAGDLSLYVDLQPPQTLLGGSVEPRESREITFGAVSGDQFAYSGELAEVRFYDGAITAAEADALVVELLTRYTHVPPEARDDQYVTQEDTPLTIDAASGVLENDRNVEPDGLTALLVEPPLHGKLTLRNDGSFDYAPDPDFFGTDQFVYRANNTADSEPATVTVEIRSVYDPPLATPDQYSLVVNESIALGVDRGVLANDVNPDGSQLTATLLEDVSHGTLSLSSDGSFSYQPAPDFVGGDRFRYQLSDGTTTTTANSVHLTVLAQPVVLNEFVASNEASLQTRVRASSADAFQGDTIEPDWIELRNFSANPADVGGLFLTDDLTQPLRWQIPAGTTIPAEGYLLVLASGLDIRDPALDEQGYLHTDFRLSAGGESLALFAADGTLLSELGGPYPRQLRDVSYGRSEIADRDPLVAVGATAQVLVPSLADADRLGDTWRGDNELEFTVRGGDDGWTTAAGGVGFDARTANPGPVLLAAFDQDASAAPLTQTTGGPGGGPFASLSDGGETGQIAEWRADQQGIAIEVHSQDNRDRDRGVGGQLAGHPLADLLRDFTHHAAPGVPGNLTVTLSGLVPGRTYELVWYTYDNSGNATTDSLPMHVYQDRVATETWLFSKSEAINVSTDPDSVAANRFAATADAAGEIVMIAGRSTVLGSDAPQPGEGSLAYFNGLEVYDPGPPSYVPLIETDLATEMRGQNASAYLRVPFLVSDPADYETLELRLRYDDGLVAYLNGREVVRRNAPEALSYNAAATLDRRPEEAVRGETVVWEDPALWLRPGENVLAIQGLNLSANDADFLLLPELFGVQNPTTRLQYFPTPTPAADNGPGLDGLVQEVTIDVPAGFYAEPVNVSFSSSTPGATLVYTTDGSPPGPTQGTQVPPTDGATAPRAELRIDATTGLRVAAFKESLLTTPAETRTYLFLSDIVQQLAIDPEVRDTTLPGFGLEEALTSIPSISLTMDPADLFGGRGIFDNPNGRGPAWRRAASFEGLSFEQGAGFQIDASVEVHGATSRASPHKPFRIVFDGQHGPTQFEFPLFVDSAVELYDLLILRASSTDGFLSGTAGPNSQGIPRWQADQALYLRDQWVRDTLLALQRPQVHGRFVHLYLNGEYWGLYNLAERPTDAFHAAHFGGEQSDYDVVHDRQELQAGDMVRWNEMFELAEAGFETDAAYQRLLGNNADGTRNPEYPVYLDLDHFVDYIIVHVYFGAEDWGDHNYWAGRRRGPESEGFRFYAWDQEIIINDLEREDPWVGDTFALTDLEVQRATSPLRRAPIWLNGKLRENENYARKLADRLQELVFHDGPLSVDQNIARLRQRAAEIDQAIVAQSARWGDQSRAVPFKREVEWLAELQRLETELFPGSVPPGLQRFIDVGLYPNLAAAEFAVNGSPQHGGAIRVGDTLTIHGPAGTTLWYTLDDTDPRGADGAPASGAVEFQEGVPIVLDSTVTVRARAWNGSEWSALNQATYEIQTKLRVSEIHFNPPGSDDAEFLELVNVGTTPIDLNGVALTDGVLFTFAGESSPLGAGETVVVARDRAAFSSHYGTSGIRLAEGQYGAPGFSSDAVTFSNAGELLRIEDAQGEWIQEFRYEDWYPETDGGGFSLEFVDPHWPHREWWNDARRWRPSGVAGGSPGVVAVRGDFDADRVVSVSDIDRLLHEVGQLRQGVQFDLNGDARIHGPDVDLLVRDILQTDFGDTDLDGVVSAASDGQTLLSNLGRGGPVGWSDGNFDGDDRVTASGDGALLLAALAGDRAEPASAATAAFAEWGEAFASRSTWE